MSDVHSGGIFPNADYVFIQGDEAVALYLGSKVLYWKQPHAGFASERLGGPAPKRQSPRWVAARLMGCLTFVERSGRFEMLCVPSRC